MSDVAPQDDQHDAELARQSEYAQGHLFTISATCRGVGRVVGNPTYTQDNWEGEPTTVQVRAFDLRTAMEKAAKIPLHQWQHFPEDESSLYGITGILGELREERSRQLAKHGDQSHLPDGTGPQVFWPGVERDENRSVSAPYLDDAFSTLADWARCRCQAASETTGDGTITFEHILTEEYFEALAEEDPIALRRELIQVAATALQWVQAIDGRPIDQS